MEAMILQFAACARASRLRVSTAEVMDCLAQLQLIDVLDEARFRRVLRANFAKSQREQHHFDHLYHLFFHELQTADAAIGAVSLAGPTRAARDWIRQQHGSQPELAVIADFMAGEPTDYLALLETIDSDGDRQYRGPGGNLGSLVRRFPILRALNRADEAVDAFLAAHRDDLHWETRDQLARHLRRRIAVARDLLVRDSSQRATAPPRPTPQQGTADTLAERDFNTLSPSEVIRVREAIARLVRKLKETTARRQAKRRRGALDVKKTLRRAAGCQGLPMAPVYRKKTPGKARIAVLCDISGSVWSSARFMLTVLHALQTCFERVRSFVFVADLAEVSRFFDINDAERAVEKVFGQVGIDMGASTDYGASLRCFRSRYMDAVNKKTTVIVMGDGRTNYANPEATVLSEIRERSRRLIWLNPETEAFWYSGDSAMRTYTPICNAVHPCRNLAQLTDFVKDLVL